MFKMTEAQCYKLQGYYLWVWQDCAGAWQARVGLPGGDAKRSTCPLKSWRGVTVFLADLAAAYEALELVERADGLRKLAAAVHSGQAWVDWPLSAALYLSNGLATLPCWAAVDGDGSDAHLCQDGLGWHLVGHSCGSGRTFRAEADEPSSLLTAKIEADDGMPPHLLRALLLALGMADRPVPVPAPVSSTTRPLPTNLVERFGALVADLVAEGGAKAELGRRILCLAADNDQACPENAEGDGLLQAFEKAARDALGTWQQRWDPLRRSPQVGPMDLAPEWGWQEVGSPEVWWGEDSDDAEGAALAESARTGRPHRLIRAVAQTELAPRGHWRSRAIEGAE